VICEKEADVNQLVSVHGSPATMAARPGNVAHKKTNNMSTAQRPFRMTMNPPRTLDKNVLKKHERGKARVHFCDGGPMAIRERIVADLTAAMKAKDTQRLGVVRMLKSRIMESEVDQRARKGPDYVLEDRSAWP
jgi:hypothetical protein